MLTYRNQLNGIFSDKSPTITDATVISGLQKDIDDWKCTEWIVYYKRIKEKFGKPKAVEVINLDSERVSFFASIHNCKYNCDFVDYFKSEGINTGNIFSKLFCNATGVVTATGDTVESVVTNTGSVAKFITNPLVIIGGLAIAGTIYYNLNYGKKKKS